MLYDNYEAKIQNIAKLRDKIIKYKVLIIIFIALLFTSLSTFTFVNGMITEDLKSVSSIQYGEDLILQAKVLFGEADFEFRKVENTRSKNEWTKVEPILPGNYEVRAVSKRSFGISSKGKTISFSISAKESTLKVRETSIIYGDSFSFIADLNEGDYFVETGVLFEDFILTTDVTPDLDNIKILNEKNVDVTSAYIFTEETSSVTFIPRTINVSLEDKSKVYDGSELTSNDYKVTNLLDNHSLDLDISGSIRNFGTSINVLNNVEVFCGDINISHMYNIKKSNATLSITKRDVVVTTNSSEKIYDGDLLENNTFKVDNLVDGDIVNLISNSNIIYFGSVKNILVVDIVNDENINNYNIKYEYGTLSITKRDIKIQTAKDSAVYDGNYLFNNNFLVLNDGLIVNDSISVINNTEIKYFGEVDNILEIKIDNDQRDVTDCYNIIYSYQKLSITKRDIIVNSTSVTFMYDDTAQGDDSHTITNLVSFDTSRVTSITTAINVSEVEKKIVVELFNDERDVTDCYSITYNNGNIIIIPRTVFVSTSSADKIYDGTPLTAEGWVYTNEDILFVEGHEFNITTTGSITSIESSIVGTTQNTYSSYSITKNGKDVLNNYDLNIELGMLAIGRRIITVETGSKKMVYDDTELVYDNFEIISENTLVLDHKLELVITGSITDVLYDGDNIIGTDNEAHSPKVYSGGKDVTLNYDIQLVFGTLTITPRLVSIISLEAQKEYDGYALQKNGIYDWSYLGDTQIVKNHDLQVFNESSLTDAGEIANVISSCSIYKFVDGEEIDVSKNYIVAISSNKLIVTKRVISITTGTDNKIYDDIALTKHDYVYDDNSKELVLDHEFNINYTGTITNFGQVSNTYNGFSIISGLEDKSKNYQVTISLGTLTVTKRDIVITTEADTLIYNGEIQYNQNYSIVNLVDGHNHYIDEITGEKNVISNGVNKYTIGISNSISEVTDNYNISYSYDKLEIQKREVVIITGSKTKIYDGEVLVLNSWYYESDLQFVDKHNFNITINGSILNVLYDGDEVIGANNTYETFSIFDGEEDVLRNYDITVNLGVLKITPKFVEVQIESNEKVYDGTELTENRFKFINNNSVVSSEELTMVIESSIINVDKISNTYVENSIVVTKENNEDSTRNYTYSILDGTLEIFARNIYIKTADDEKVYDGEELVNDDWFYTKEEYDVLESLGHYLDIKIIGSIINVGSTPNNCLEEVVVRYGDGTVNNNYKIHLVLGVLEITTRIIHLVSESDEKVYDGTPLTNDNWNYLDGSLEVVNNDNIKHTINFDMDSYIINFGKIDNLIENITIIDSNNVSVIDNYTIKKTIGELEITKRNITITTQESSKEYDGEVLLNDNLIIEQFEGDRGLVATDNCVVDFKTEILLVGTKLNEVTVNIFNHENENINDNYQIKYIYESYLEVTKRNITITTYDVEETYNGDYIFDNRYLLSKDLGLNDEFNLISDTKEYNAGEYKNKLTYSILKGEDDVSNCYNFSEEFGNIVINRLKISYVTGSDEKEYDAQVLENTSLTIVSLAENDRYEITNNSKFTYWTNGKKDNIIEFSIYNDKFNVYVTDNYEIESFVHGTLEIFKREISVSTGSQEFEYNGTPQKWEVKELSKEFVDEVTFEFINSVTNVFDGEVDNLYSITILNEKAINSYTIISLEIGIIKVNPREVEVKIVDKTKVYDGASLTSNEIDASRLLDGHVLSILTNGYIIDAGIVENNYIEDSKELTGLDADLRNYSFTFIKGKLEITPKDIIITTGTSSKPYDGTALTNGETSHTPLVSDDEIRYNVIGTRTEVGVSVNEITDVEFVKGNPDNYNIVENLGSLNIIQSKIYVYTGSNKKVYDDEILIEHSYIIKDEEENILDIFLDNPIFTGGIINAGVTANTLDESSLNVVGDTNNFYVIEVKPGKLEVLRRNVIVYTEENVNAEYNGLDQIFTGWETKENTGKLVAGHTITVVDPTVLKDFDDQVYSNEFTALVFKGEDDVTQNYNIEYKYGKIKIVQREVIVFIKDGLASLTYNGMEQGISAEHLTGINLIDFHTLNVIYSPKAIKPTTLNVTGQYRVNIFNDTENETDNYIINYVTTDEYLEINKATVILKTGSAEFFYTGEEYYVSLAEIIGASITGDVFIFNNTTKVIEAGTYDNEHNNDGFILISPNLSNDEDYSVLYNVEISDELGQLIVDKAEILIDTSSKSKTYDGTILYDDLFDFVEGFELPFGHELQLLETTQISEVLLTGDKVDSVENKFASYIITNENDEDVTESFNVKVRKYGMLTIIPRVINVNVFNNSKNPQADSQFINYYENYKYFTILNEEDLLGNVFITNASETGITDKIELVDYQFTLGEKNNTHNFILKQTGGDITYNKINITLTADSLDVEYTGSVFFVTTYTLSGQSIHSDHTINVSVSGYGHKRGNYVTKITTVSIKDSKGNELVEKDDEGNLVSKYYNITLIDGSIKIN